MLSLLKQVPPSLVGVNPSSLHELEKLVVPSAQNQEPTLGGTNPVLGGSYFAKIQKIALFINQNTLLAARRFLHLRTLPPSQQLRFPSISNSIGYDPNYWDYGSFLTLPIHEFIYIFPLDCYHYRNSQFINPKIIFLLFHPI